MESNKMELKIEDGEVFYPSDRENWFEYAVWNHLHGYPDKNTIEQMVKDNERINKPFQIEVTFKSGLGKNTALITFRKYQG